ncbi:MAG: cytochrome C oxidase subunit IV family protein [Verrucomicrobia bacterium]|nr:cytochrome C oxidase subunit IV family protein [Verrucomicrobiota bacterium]
MSHDHSHSHGPGEVCAHDHAHDDHSSPEAIQRTIKKYFMVGGVLFGGTVLTVAMYYIHIPSVAATIAIALLIASVKAAFVAGVFMHLSDERKMIYGILVCTVFFLVGLMGLTLWAMNDFPSFTIVDGKPA